MQKFTINDKYTIVCTSKGTRNGFYHRATLSINGSESINARVSYINRTWEAWTFQTVIHCLFDKMVKVGIITEDQRKEFRDKLR
jgi:hypothetical protein